MAIPLSQVFMFLKNEVMLDYFFPLPPLTSKTFANSVSYTFKIFLKFHDFKDQWKHSFQSF